VLGQLWATAPSEYSLGVANFAVANQTTAPRTAIAGTTVPLPMVKTAASDPNPITWTVVSGAATINQTAGTITYGAAGPVLLAWSDSITSPCPPTPNPWVGYSCPDATTSVTQPFFSGQVSVNVTAAGTSVTPSVPDSSAENDPTEIIASTTGGAARLANGTDTYTLVATVQGTNGLPLTGYASALTATGPANVTLSTTFTDNGDGTYSITAASATPGNYTVTISLNGTVIGTIPVNFIAADIAQPTRVAGQTQSADGLGFQPGEMVTVTVYSNPIVLGTFPANSAGTVPVTFTIPAGFPLGRHTVEFTGERSGTVVVAFDVIAGTGAPTGGTAATTPSTTPAALALALSLVLAAGVATVGARARRTR